MNWAARRQQRRKIAWMLGLGPKAIWRVVLAVWRMIVSVVRSIGREEVTVATGVVMITVALWPAIGQLALLPAGMILVWVGLPSRARFIVPPEARRDRRHE